MDLLKQYAIIWIGLTIIGLIAGFIDSLVRHKTKEFKEEVKRMFKSLPRTIFYILLAIFIVGIICLVIDQLFKLSLIIFAIVMAIVLVFLFILF